MWDVLAGSSPALAPPRRPSEPQGSHGRVPLLRKPQLWMVLVKCGLRGSGCRCCPRPPARLQPCHRLWFHEVTGRTSESSARRRLPAMSVLSVVPGQAPGCPSWGFP